MAKTFRDGIMEFAMYPHSTEFYQLQKEAAEITLMGKFLEDQQFLKENAPLLNSGVCNLTEGYMQESVDDTTLESMNESFKEKVGGFGQKIVNGLKKVVQFFAKLLNRISQVGDDLTKRGQKVLKSINSATVTEDLNSQLSDVVSSALKGENVFPVRLNQPAMKTIKAGIGGTGSMKNLKNYIAAALARDVVVADVKKPSSGDIGAVDFESFKHATDGLLKGKKKSTVEGAHTTLKGAWSEAEKNGVHITVNTGKINEYKTTLEKLVSQLDQMHQQASEKAAEAGKPKTVVGTDTRKNDPAFAAGLDLQEGLDAQARGEAAQAHANLLKDLTTCCSETMNLYAGLNTYRTKVIEGLEGIFKARDNSKGGEE